MVLQLVLCTILLAGVNCYNLNRGVCMVPTKNIKNCDYFENPALNHFVQSRVGEADDFYYPFKFDQPTKLEDDSDKPISVPGLDLAPKKVDKYSKYRTSDLESLRQELSSGETEDKSEQIDTTKLWKVDEVKQLMAMRTLPDVFVDDSEKVEDAPPISDQMPRENSEVTIESSDIHRKEWGESGHYGQNDLLQSEVALPEDAVVYPIETEKELEVSSTTEGSTTEELVETTSQQSSTIVTTEVPTTQTPPSNIQPIKARSSLV